MKIRAAFIILLLLVLAYALGPTPDTPDYSVELPVVPSNLEELDVFVTKQEARPDIKPGNHAKTIWLGDSSREVTEYVLLYLHGFSASAMEGEPVISDFLNRYPMNAYVARLATHGLDTIDELINYQPDRIWESAKQALAIAEKMGDKIIIMSTSTGGTLALKLAATYPDKIHALINMSPNIRVKDPNSWFLNKPWGLQIARLTFGGNFRNLSPEDSNYAKYWYDSYRLESVVYLQELVESTMNEETFQDVICPVLSLYYYKDDENQDEVVSTDRIQWMHKKLGTNEEEKRAVPIANAETHVIGCGLYSKAIPEVETAIFQFADEIIQLEPTTL